MSAASAAVSLESDDSTLATTRNTLGGSGWLRALRESRRGAPHGGLRAWRYGDVLPRRRRRVPVLWPNTAAAAASLSCDDPESRLRRTWPRRLEDGPRRRRGCGAVAAVRIAVASICRRRWATVVAGAHASSSSEAHDAKALAGHNAAIGSCPVLHRGTASCATVFDSRWRLWLRLRLRLRLRLGLLLLRRVRLLRLLRELRQVCRVWVERRLRELRRLRVGDGDPRRAEGRPRNLGKAAPPLAFTATLILLYCGKDTHVGCALSPCGIRAHPHPDTVTYHYTGHR